MDDILRILEQDARTSPERIAEMTGRSVDDVREIIIEAEKNGVILSYKSQINWVMPLDAAMCMRSLRRASCRSACRCPCSADTQDTSRWQRKAQQPTQTMRQ